MKVEMVAVSVSERRARAIEPAWGMAYMSVMETSSIWSGRRKIFPFTEQLPLWPRATSCRADEKKKKPTKVGRRGGGKRKIEMNP